MILYTLSYYLLCYFAVGTILAPLFLLFGIRSDDDQFGYSDDSDPIHTTNLGMWYMISMWPSPLLMVISNWVSIFFAIIARICYTILGMAVFLGKCIFLPKQ